MRLFIAEKPELAQAIAEGLGGGTRRKGYIDCGDDIVTWCFGHMLVLLDPEDYDERYAKWNMDDLPFAHIPWRKKPGEDREEQLAIILDLLSRATSVVNAGDPDDEGQLLVDEILEYANCTLPTQRVLVNDYNLQLVQRALANMRDNSEFAGLYAAANARSVADQLYGYNMTRAYTLVAQKAGYDGVLSVGRVQTPILGMVVRRDRAFESHQKSYYHNITGTFAFGDLTFPARYQIKKTDEVDEKGRLVDETAAKRIAHEVTGKPAAVLSTETKAKTQAPPLPYNLLKLQTDASRKFGIKPDAVKDITQSLREKHKLITYNRSDCQYLSEEQHGDAPAVLDAIKNTAPALAKAAGRADPAVKSRAFNSAKTGAHHGIIPTIATADFSKLTDGEQKIYLLIARAYIAQFWPTYKYDQTTAVVQVKVDDSLHDFAVRANFATDPGWKLLYQNDKGNEELEGDEDDLAADLRSLGSGSSGRCEEGIASRMETKPQPRYTMDTLLMDLTRVAKYIKDDELRAALIERDKGKDGEHGGIGTPATRDSILANLFERGYLVEDGKHIVSSKTAREFYDALPDVAKYPDMTAVWVQRQKEIEGGELDQVDFIRSLVESMRLEINRVATEGLGLKIQTIPCPDCKRPLRRHPNGAKGPWWGCSGFQEGCKATFPDKGGRPVLVRKPKLATTASSEHKCAAPGCGKGLIRRPGQKPGTFWWSCSGFPACKQTYLDRSGLPNFDAAKGAKA